MRWKAQLVVLGLNGRIRRTPGYAGGYLFNSFDLNYLNIYFFKKILDILKMKVYYKNIETV